MTGTSVIFEVRTAAGQLLSIRCSPDDREAVQRVLETQVARISLPTSRGVKTNVSHGGYGRYSRYDVEQLHYAGAGSSYIEALVIKDAPEGRAQFVLHESRPEDSHFWEFNTRKGLVKTFESWWGSVVSRRGRARDVIREVRCGSCSPWFYAVGDQEVVGDIVVPSAGILADPYYTNHRRFLVRDTAGLFQMKRVLCVHQCERGRRVTWYDGTYWDEWTGGPSPQPMDEGEPWIQEAMDRFRELLAGGRTSFVIPFVDGVKFTGRISGHENRHSTEGTYKARVRVRNAEGEEQILEGAIEHRRTAEVLTVEDTIRLKARINNCEVVEIESCVRELKRGSRGWAGVFTRIDRDPGPEDEE